MNPKNNLLALFVLVLMVSCEKELPPYDERFGYVDGIFNDDAIKSENNTNDNFSTARVFYSPFCNGSGHISFAYKMEGVISFISVAFIFENLSKVSGKCYDKFEILDSQSYSTKECDFNPVLTGCYENSGQCDVSYLPDPTKKSYIQIYKVKEKYITGELDVYLLPKYVKPNFPWSKSLPRNIHFKVNLFIAPIIN